MAKTYILRVSDPKMWQKVRVKATQHGESVKAVIERLLAEWLKTA